MILSAEFTLRFYAYMVVVLVVGRRLKSMMQFTLSEKQVHAMTRIVCLWLPNWPIQRIVQGRPELEEKPIALVASGPRGGQISACSREAAAQGIHIGMPIAEAQAKKGSELFFMREEKILPPCPENSSDPFFSYAFFPYEPERDRRALEQLAEACEQFSPCVGLEEGDNPESLLLDISNLEHLWGSEARLAKRVETFFTRRGYRVRLAVADTVGLAWGLAHFAIADSSNQTAIRNRKSEINLPVEALRIADDTAALLRQLGIETIGQLQSLPREELTSRFGDELLRRLDQFTGAALEVIVPHRPAAALEISYSLDEPTADRELLTHILSDLVEQLSRQLAARDQGAVLLMCLLRYAGGHTVPDGNTVPLRIGLLQPSARARQLMELIDLHLETVRLREEVGRVEVRVVVVGRLGERQGELFANGWPRDSHQLSVLVNRLSSRLGYKQVLRAELGKSPISERAARWVATTEKKDKETRRREGKETPRRTRSRCLPVPLSPGLRPPRPLLLHPQPQALEVVCIAPDGPPQFVWLENRRQRIVHHAGPERIETLWWRGPTLRRDYYRIALESGSHLWIFRRLADGRWFLHGAFA